MTPSPARSTGRFAASRASAARATVSGLAAGYVVRRAGIGSRSTSAGATSSGSSMWVALGFPRRGRRNAVRTISGTVTANSTRAFQLVTGAKSRITSRYLVRFREDPIQRRLPGDGYERPPGPGSRPRRR